MPIPFTNMMPLNNDRRDIGFGLEPAFNVHDSLVLLARASDISGLGDWVYRTVDAMSAEERERHLLVIIGLFYAARPEASYPSYPLYLEHLASLSPLQMRDKIMNAYISLARMSDHAEPSLIPTDFDEILADVDSFLAFLKMGFSEDNIFPEVERRAYTYLIDPPALHELVVSHLRHMWHRYAAVEWERVRPMLQKSVKAYEQVDYRGMDRGDIVRFVLGRDDNDDCDWLLSKLQMSDTVTFVPSAHTGPYVHKYYVDGHLWVLFGARQPEGAMDVPELSRAEILVRLSALSDDMRLSILKLVADEGELKSQDIMQALDLSQSAASRQLKQLSAAGFLQERRCNGAKCYRFNPERLRTTVEGLTAYLSDEVLLAL